MPATEIEMATGLVPADRIALVLAQLEPIRSREALLDSYRRESLCRLATTARAAGSAAEVLDLAYATRWRELKPDSPVNDSDEDLWLMDE
jgi:hypothetical protein